MEDSEDTENAMTGSPTSNRETLAQLTRANRRLEKTVEQLLAAQKISRTGSWRLVLETGEVEWSDQLYRNFGFDPADSPPHFSTHHSLMTPESWTRLQDAMARLMESGEPYELELEMTLSEGESHWGVARGEGLRDETGKVVEVVGTYQDITEQRVAERALESSEALLRQFVKSAPAAIAMMDNNVCYIQASDRWIEDYGLEEVDIIGRCHYDVFPDIPQRWKEIHQRVLRGETLRMKEDPFTREDGSVVWLQWECQPWRVSSGQIGGLLFFTQVITERKLLEERLLQQQEELTRSNRDLEQFAYVASHDLQAPLRSVSSCAQLLSGMLGDDISPEVQEVLSHILTGAERMRSMIGGIFELSTVETVTPDKLPLVDLEEVVEEATLALRLTIEESDATVMAEPLPTVRAHRGQMVQLFVNLLDNAIRYRSSEAPVVEVRFRGDGPQYEISVLDNGVGIPSSQAEKVFGLFKRLYTFDDQPGTGIGLPLCRKIVERHGGEIWTSPNRDRGSIFTFTLPKSPS